MKPIKSRWFLKVAIVLLMAGCYEAPIADFEMDNTEAEAPATINFSNLSENASRYIWEFGDNSQSEEMSPAHIYSNEGEYKVRLIVKGKGGIDETERTLTITPPEETTYQFRNNSSYNLYNVNSYFWDGDQILDLQTHGNMSPGDMTTTITTVRNTIYVSFYNQDQTVFYLIDPVFSIQEGEDNILEFNNNTTYSSIDLEDEDSKNTTYRFTNQSSIRLMNVVTFYGEDNIVYDRYEHGNLNIGDATNEVSTSYEYVYVGFYTADFLYYCVVNPPYELTPDQSNNLIFDDNTTFNYYPQSAVDSSMLHKSMIHKTMINTEKLKPTSIKQEPITP